MVDLMVSMQQDPELQLVIDSELELLRPHVRRCAGQLDALLHPGFFEFGASGRRWNRDETIEALTAGQEAGRDAPAAASELAAIRLADDVILLTYISRQGQRRALRSSLWRRTDAGWRIYFHQGTLLPAG
jgi:hypothetical protein